MTRASQGKTKKLQTSRAWSTTPLMFGDVLRNVDARHGMIHSLNVFISLLYALVNTTQQYNTWVVQNQKSATLKFADFWFYCCVVLTWSHKSDRNTLKLCIILWHASTLRKTSPNFKGVVDHALEVWSFFVLSFEARVIDWKIILLRLCIPFIPTYTRNNNLMLKSEKKYGRNPIS